MSFGTTQASDISPLSAAVADARAHGCLVVAAVGNTDIFGETDIVYPAACSGVVGVAATTPFDQLANFSVRGSRPGGGGSVAILAAPGVAIWSTWYDSVTLSGYWQSLHGTSMATPFVSGAAAVVWSLYPWMNADQVLSVLIGSAVDLGAAGRDTSYGYGRLQVDGALSGRDRYESDDTTRQAFMGGSGRSIAAGGISNHTALPAGDVDWWYTDLVAGRTYRFWTGGLVGSADTSLALHAPDGLTVLAANDDAAPGNPASSIVWKAPFSGRYFLANADPRMKGGGYTVRMAIVKVATSITIRSSATNTRYRKKFTLKGVLSPGRIRDRCRVEVRKPRTSRWVLASTRKAGKSGHWSYTYTPKSRGRFSFRVRFAGDIDRKASASRWLSVRVK
jgi:hypothetical protein